jgi:hypothetical protein
MASKSLSLSVVACLAVCFVLTAPGLAQTKAKKNVQTKADSLKTITSQVATGVSPGGAGELIELEEVQIHGEIALPNVAITVARAEPQFREITLEHTPAEGLSDLDLSGLRDGTPPPDKIRNWKEMVKRPRR